jgi:hypothetical protein
MNARFGEKIRDAGHNPVPGLLPILKEIEEWPEVSSILAGRFRGNGGGRREHNLNDRSQITALRYVFSVDHGVKFRAVGKDVSQDVIVLGKSVPELERRMKEYIEAYIPAGRQRREQWPRRRAERAVRAPRVTKVAPEAPEATMGVPVLPEALPEIEIMTVDVPRPERKRRGPAPMPKNMAKVVVTQKRIKEIAIEVYGVKRQLVSTELAYLSKKLGKTATPEEIKANVESLRSLPWGDLISFVEN